MVAMETVKIRQDERYLVRDLAVYDGRTNAMLGNVLNLSLSGMLITYKNAPAVNEVIKVKLRHLLNSYSDFEGEAVVKWFRQNDISGLFGVGLSFVGNGEEQRSLLQRLVNTYAVVGV